jgi:hypothetical protein
LRGETANQKGDKKSLDRRVSRNGNPDEMDGNAFPRGQALHDMSTRDFLANGASVFG